MFNRSWKRRKKTGAQNPTPESKAPPPKRRTEGSSNKADHIPKNPLPELRITNLE